MADADLPTWPEQTPSGRPTICVFAPAPLLTVTIERAVNGREELHLHPGGQGFWVARLAALLGADPVLCAPLGGETGEALAHLFDQAEIRVRAVDMLSANGSYIHDRRAGERLVVWESELEVLGRHELDELYTLTLSEALAAGVCVLTGTHEQGIVEPDTYRRLASDLTANGVKVVADLSGDLLEATLDGGVQLVKISHEELAVDGYAEADDPASVREGIERLRAAGATSVVVSLAERGSLAYLDGRWLEARAPSMQVVDPRGAGDSMTAALACAVALGLDPEASLRLAAGAGAVNVTRHGLGTGRRDAITQLATKVEVRLLETEHAG